MLRNRDLLEVLKWLSPDDLLRHTSIVSKQWQGASQSDEVWASLSETFGLETVRPAETTSCAFFRKQYCVFSLYVISNDFVQSYDVRKLAWNEAVHIETEFPFGLLSAIVLVNSNLIVTGTCRPPSGQSAMLSTINWSVKMLPTMLRSRYRHGSLYYQGCVYVFGGTCSEDRNTSNTAEKLHIAHGQTWLELPTMPEELCFSTPCRNGSVAYIFGGWGTDACLMLDLCAEMFSRLPFRVETSGYLTTSFVFEGQLYSFQTGSCLSWCMEPNSPPVYRHFSDTINANWYD